MPIFSVAGFEFEAEGLVDGVLLNPVLPEAFDDTPNEERPQDQQKFWDVPFITTMTAEDWERHDASLDGEHAAAAQADWRDRGRAEWFASWPTGTRYDVRCLDGGAWDRSTNWGSFATVEEAAAQAKAGSPHGDMKALRAAVENARFVAPQVPRVDPTVLDRFARWQEAVSAALPPDERYEKRHTYSFGWWPDAEILRTAEFGLRCRWANDGRFWKNGDIRKPAKYLMQLEIVLRYGPLALDGTEIDELADEIENYVQHCPFEDQRIDVRSSDCIIGQLFQIEEPRQDPALFEALDNAYKDPSKALLCDLLPACLDMSPNHPDELAAVVRFCASAGTRLLDDTGWLVTDWRNMAFRTYIQALGFEIPGDAAK